MDEATRWRRSEDLIGIPDVDTWPRVNLDLLPPEFREAVGARVEAVTLYVRGLPIAAISTRTGVTSQLPALVKRCLELSPDGQIWGFRALTPYFRIKHYERQAAIFPKRQEQRGGHAGALGALVKRFPDIEKQLIALIKKEARHFEVPEHRIRPKDLHRIFISLLRKRGLTQSEWPFNTKYLGIRSIQRYMKDVLDTNFDRAVNSREESAARAHLAVGKGIEPLLSYEEPFDAVEIDAYSINALFSVAFETPEGGETEVLLERLWLIAALEHASNSVLAYKIVYSSEVSADDGRSEPTTYAMHRIEKADSSWEKSRLPEGVDLKSFIANGGLQFLKSHTPISLKAWVSKMLGDQLAETKLEGQRLTPRNPINEGYELAVTRRGMERVDRFAEKIGDIRKLEAALTEKLHQLKRYHVPESEMLPILCRTFGIQVTRDVALKPTVT